MLGLPGAVDSPQRGGTPGAGSGGSRAENALAHSGDDVGSGLTLPLGPAGPLSLSAVHRLLSSVTPAERASLRVGVPGAQQEGAGSEGGEPGPQGSVTPVAHARSQLLGADTRSASPLSRLAGAAGRPGAERAAAARAQQAGATGPVRGRASPPASASEVADMPAPRSGCSIVFERVSATDEYEVVYEQSQSQGLGQGQDQGLQRRRVACVPSMRRLPAMSLDEVRAGGGAGWGHACA